MLQLTDVKKNYGTFALDISMQVQPGRITGLIGANGAGKSTTFKAILDLISIDAGTITVFGKPAAALTVQDKEEIGAALSDSGFSEYLTVADVTAILRNMYHKFNEAEFKEKCRYFGLPEKKKIKEFSTGMRAKLKLLAAMSHDAKLLILDEPTAGLDVVAREEMLEMLQDYLADTQGEERAVLISSHISSDLEKFCDDLYMIDNGRIILHEETDVLLDGYGILKVDEAQYERLDQKYLLARKHENFGYSVLVGERQYYQKNYPDFLMEKSSIDDVIIMMTKGERL